MPVVLQLAGVIIIIAEIFLPSGGLLSLIAAGLFGYSLFIVFHDISTMAGTYFVLADLFIIPLLVAVGLKVVARELESFMGREGKSVTDLHPGGTAIIDDKRLDVVSRGEYIEKDRNLIVVEVTGNQIIVREK
jgi:membrane-bound serine protease (ClpP class)